VRCPSPWPSLFSVGVGSTGNLFIERALADDSIAVLPIHADMVDARGWDATAMRDRVAQFLEERFA